MVCPHCRSEYEEGAPLCPKCGILLRGALPPEPAPEYVEFEEILSTSNAVEIAIIKSLLDPEGIDYYFKSEFFNYMEPLAQPARLMVSKDQADEAREILMEFGGLSK
jgi:hypothetical protein